MNNRKFLLLANAALAALILWTGTRIVLTWLMVSPGERNRPAGDDASMRRMENTIPKPKPLRHFEPIVRHNIFFRHGSASSRPKRAVKAMPAALALTLKGTAIGQGQKSYAIILDQKTRKQGLYPENGFIQGARISRIGQDRIMLKMGTKTQELPLTPERKGATTPGPMRGSGHTDIQATVKSSSTSQSSPGYFSTPAKRNLHRIRLSGKPKSTNPHNRRQQ